MNISYFDSLIDARREGLVSAHVHLGLFPDAGSDAGPLETLGAAQIRMALHHLAPLDLTDGASIVDIGCGFGGTLRLIDGQLGRARLTGVNIDPRQIELARSGDWHNPVDWVLCDAAQFSSGCVQWADRILSLEAMFHFPDPSGFFVACAQALRPSGRMVASTILFAPEARTASVAPVCEGFGPWPHPDMTLAQLCAMATDAGLSVLGSENLAPMCLPGFDWMCPPCPPEVTDNPVTELRRLFEAGQASYPMIVLSAGSQAGGKTQK